LKTAQEGRSGLLGFFKKLSFPVCSDKRG
jgi:hypothetical protein